jgi:acid phosphatase
MTWRRLLGAGVLAAVAACSPSAPVTSTPAPPPPSFSAAPAGRDHPYAHVVVVVEENHSYDQIVGSADAPYLNGLIRAGVLFTRSYGVAHPSEPNYLALFSGSTHRLSSDACPLTYSGPDLYSLLRRAGRTFVGYAEGLPAAGSKECSSGSYARKHAPWTDFTDVPAAAQQPLSALPSDYAELPSVAFVIPDLTHDMHDGSIAEADTWLRAKLASYVGWARAHDSLLVVTFDEDDFGATNHIATVAVGAGIRAGTRQSQRIDHRTVFALLAHGNRLA